MADNTKTNDPFETGSKSLLRAGIAGVPFAAGIGIGISRLLSDGIVVPRASAISDTIQTVTAHSSAPPRPSYNDHLVFMNNSRNKGMFKGTGTETARTAWTHAMQFADPFAKGRLPSAASQIENLPSDQVIDAITQMSTYEGKMTTRLFSRFRNNLSALSGSSMGAFTKVSNLPFNMLDNMKNMPLDSNLQSRIESMASGKAFTSEFITRPGFAEEGLGMHKISFGVAGKRIDFNLPKSMKGVLVEGQTLSSRRIAPGYGIIDPVTKSLEQITREEFFLRELEGGIVADIHGGRIKTQPQVKKAINELYQRVFSSLESIPNVTPEMRTFAQQRYQDIRGNALDLVTSIEHRKTSGTGYSEMLRTANQDEIAQTMEAHGLYGGTGGEGLSKGRVQRTNLSERSLFPKAVSWSRKPEASIREFELTKDSQKSIAASRHARYRDYEVIETELSHGITQRAPLTSPHMKALYVNPDLHSDFLEKQLLMGEGESIGTAGLRDLIEHEFVRTKHLKTIAGENFDDFATSIKEGKFKPGDVLGWDQSGDVIKMQKNMRLLKVAANNTRGKGDFATLYFSDIRRLENNAKWFGDFKGLMRLTNEGFLNNAVRKLTKNKEMLRDLDVIVSMDELKKDPSKYSKQILTSITESVRARGGLKEGTLATDIAMRPRHYAGILEKAAIKKGAFSSEEFTKSAMKLAAELNFTQSEFGAAFGAAPTVLGKETAEQITSEVIGNIPGYKEAISKGLAAGVAQVTYGGPEELRGAGKLGSIEPRAFEILRGSGFKGEIGPALQKEFTERLISDNYEALDTHKALTKTIGSMEGIYKPKTGDNIFDVAREFKDPKYKENFQFFIEKGGGWLDPGKGMHSVYIPGPETTLSMQPYQTAGGIKTSGSLAGTYHEIAQSAGEMYSDISPTEVSDVKNNFMNIAKDLHKQQAPAGKGMGSFLRGKLTGSRFFTGVSAENTGFRSSNLFEVGLSESYAKKMFEELKSTNMYNRSQISEMEKRFMTGQSVGGVIARHPFIDDFSMQQILFKRAQTTQAQIVIPELTMGVKVKGMQAEHKIQLGPLVGMAGDKDADIFSAMLVSPDNEKLIRKNIMSTDSEYAQRYVQHQVRYQMMKAGKPEMESLPTIKSMIGESRALATTPEWVPRLSTQMSQAKSAIRRFGPGGKESADAQALLTWMEQTPIGGKHLSAQQAYSGELGTMMRQLSQGIDKGDKSSIKEVMSDIMRGNKLSESLLKGPVHLEKESINAINQAYGKNVISGELSGPNIDSALNIITESFNQYKSSGALREEQHLFARGTGLKASEIPELIGMTKALEFGGTSTFSSVSSAFQSSRNIMGALGKKMIKNARPVGIGFAAMLGLGAVLSTPDELVGPGAGHIPHGKINMNARKAGERIDPEDLHPPVRNIGIPRAPNMLRQRSAIISPRAVSKNTYVTGIASKRSNITGILAQAGSMSGNRNMSVNITDQRSSMNQHIIANKIA